MKPDHVDCVVGITEHVVEGRLGEGVEVGQGLTALGAQRVGLVQDRRDPSLLGEARKRQPEVLKYPRLELLGAVGSGAHLGEDGCVLGPQHRSQEGGAY